MPTFETPPPDADLEQEVVRLIELEENRLDNRRAWFEVVLEHRTNALTANERFALQLNRDINALHADLMDVHNRKDELERAVFNKAQEQARLREMLDDAWKQSLINRKYIDTTDQANENLNAQNRALAMQATQVENQMCEILGRFHQMEADNVMLYQTIKDANRAVKMSTTVLTQVRLDAAQREQLVEQLLEEQSFELSLLQEAFDRMIDGLGQMYVDHMHDTSAETESWEDTPSEDYDDDEPRMVEVMDYTPDSPEMVGPFMDAEDGELKADAAALLSQDYSPAGGYHDGRQSFSTPGTISTEQVGNFLTDIDNTPGQVHHENPVDAAYRGAVQGHDLVDTLSFNTWRARGQSDVDVDSDDEDESDSGDDVDGQRYKRQHGARNIVPLETDVLFQDPPKCWCSKVGTLADSMEALTLEDLVVEVSNKQQTSPNSPTRVTLANGSSPEVITTSVFSALKEQSDPACEDPNTPPGKYRSIAIQTEDLSVPEDTTSFGRTRPLGGPPRPSRSFNANTNGPIYLSPWYNWAPWWMSRPSSQVEHNPQKVDLPYPKVKPPLHIPDDIDAPLSPIRRTLTDPLIRMPARDSNVPTYQEQSTTAGYHGPEKWIRYTPSMEKEDRHRDIRRHRRRTRPPPVPRSSWKDWLWMVLGIVTLVWSLIPGAGERRERDIRNDVKKANELPGHILQEIRDNRAKNEHRMAHMMNYEAEKRSRRDRVELG